MSKIQTPAGAFTIDHQVAYVQHVIYSIDEYGDADYQNELHEFDQELADDMDGYWNVIYQDKMVETIVDSVGYDEVVAYIEYLAGWLETHPSDIVPFTVYRSSLAK